MPGLPQLPFDRLQQQKPKAKNSAAELNLKRLAQASCFIFLETARLAISTILIILGLPLFVFLFLVGWDLGLLFTQLGNLSAHYHSAEPSQRLLFSEDVQITFIILTGGLLIARMPGFFRMLEQAFPENQKGRPK